MKWLQIEQILLISSKQRIFQLKSKSSRISWLLLTLHTTLVLTLRSQRSRPYLTCEAVWAEANTETATTIIWTSVVLTISSLTIQRVINPLIEIVILTMIQKMLHSKYPLLFRLKKRSLLMKIRCFLKPQPARILPERLFWVCRSWIRTLLMSNWCPWGKSWKSSRTVHNSFLSGKKI